MMTTHHDTMRENIQSEPEATAAAGDNLLIILCAPSHDDLTEYTSKLLENFPDLGAPVELRIFESPLKYDQLLSQLSVDPNKTEVALVFCGHGNPSSLLGPGAHPGEPNYRTIVSTFYDNTLINLRPKRMLAFCCSAAAVLGKSYERTYDESTFIGFDVEIGIVTVDGVYAKWWTKILHGLASAMLNAPDGEAMENAVQALYKEAIDFFHSHDKKYKWARAMKWYLLGQSKAIKVVYT